VAGCASNEPAVIAAIGQTVTTTMASPGGWQDVREVDFEVRDHQDSLARARYTPADGSFGLYDPGSQQWLTGQAGKGSLQTAFVTLVLTDSVASAGGADAQNAAIAWRLVFSDRALGRAADQVIQIQRDNGPASEEPRLVGRWYIEPAIEVTTTADNGPGSFRQAIQAAITATTPSAIVFQIPTSDPGYANGTWTIAPKSILPSIAGSYSIAIVGPVPAGQPVTDTITLVALDGANAGQAVDGLTLSTRGDLVEHLAIGGFDGNGINIVGISTLQVGVRYTRIGTDATGTQPKPNGEAGIIFTAHTTGNVVGPGVIIENNHGAGIAYDQADPSQNTVTPDTVVRNNNTPSTTKSAPRPLLTLSVVGLVVLGLAGLAWWLMSRRRRRALEVRL
jgi:hypothetical protein